MSIINGLLFFFFSFLTRMYAPICLKGLPKIFNIQWKWFVYTSFFVLQQAFQASNKHLLMDFRIYSWNLGNILMLIYYLDKILIKHKIFIVIQKTCHDRSTKNATYLSKCEVLRYYADPLYSWDIESRFFSSNSVQWSCHYQISCPKMTPLTHCTLHIKQCCHHRSGIHKPPLFYIP